jgi:hypothetical protein
MIKSTFIASLLLLSQLSFADVISIAQPSYDVPNSAEGILRPTRGMSMAAVAKQFGQPNSKVSAIGQPPISRWVYNDFVVFFEHSHVIDAVIPK